jgi:hypothetical protein
MKAAFVIPTIHPDEFFEFIGKSLPHISNLQGKVGFALCCQKPWTSNQVTSARNLIWDYGFECRVVEAFSREIGEVAPSMTRLRHHAAGLFPESEYYIFGDDNIQFTEGTRQFPRSSGERYAEVIDYMDHFCKCGVVCCVGALGGMPQQYKIKPTSIGLIATSRGLFIRNLKKSTGLFLPEVVGLSGGLEETAATYPIVDEGYFVAKQFFNPTQLKNVHKLTGEHPADSIHNDQVIRLNIQDWVRRKWSDPFWSHDGRKFPPLLQHNFSKATGTTLKDVANNSAFIRDYR